MVRSVSERVAKLWDTWNIRALIIVSLFLQSFLILFAPLRRQRGGKWAVVRIGIWMAYLLADWVAIFTIGLIFHAERSDILALWAPFLLLHLGGPDTITSFSLEDNELWVRHLLGLLLQVGSIIYISLLSLSNNKLWLPTLLVLIAGIIKYAERNRAFYLASFEHFGNNWAPITESTHAPVQFSSNPRRLPVPLRSRLWHHPLQSKVIVSFPRWRIDAYALYLFGAIKNLLVGPPMSSIQKWYFQRRMHKKGSHEMLVIIEIHLSLLYELLHTKLPVVDSKLGYVLRIINFSCLLGALLSFSLFKKYYLDELVEFDITLTYVLLIGALTLDLISIILLSCSDWVFIAYSDARKKDSYQFGHKRRWSKLVPQLNILDCHFKNKDGELVDFLGIRSLFRKISRIQCVSFKNFVEDEVWSFIFTTVKEKYTPKEEGRILHPDADIKFDWSLSRFEHMESLLIWHIATEICYQKEGSGNSPSSSSSKKVCKLLSDYMFFLLVMEPTMIVGSPQNLKKVFEGLDMKDKTWEWPRLAETHLSNVDEILNKRAEEVRNLKTKIQKKNKLETNVEEPPESDNFSRVTAAYYLAKELLRTNHRWELMGKVWVEIVCYAAINCQPIVHARQVSKGGQLLTLVWLMMNYCGFTPAKDWYGVGEEKEPEHESEITSVTPSPSPV